MTFKSAHLTFKAAHLSIRMKYNLQSTNCFPLQHSFGIISGDASDLQIGTFDLQSSTVEYSDEVQFAVNQLFPIAT